MATKKKRAKKRVTAAKYRLKAVKVEQHAAMVATYRQQVAKIQGSPGYAGQPAVQTACTNVSSGCDTLDKTLTALAKNHADGVALATTRDQQAVALDLEHTSLEALLNTVCGGDPAQVVAWSGEVATRQVLVATSDGPVNPVAETTATAGSVLTKCQKDPTAICYLFQQGSDPAHPESWPPPVIEGGCKHVFAGLTIGQKAYFRIAIVRRGTGQGTWSGVLEVLVR